MKLWHGSRYTDSSMIVEGEEGFDMKFARDGLHGIGNYFAIFAQYSCGA